MKKLAYILMMLITGASLQNCEDTYLPPELKYITFAKTAYSTGVDVGGTTTLDVTVYTGSIAGSDKTFNIIVDGSGAADGSYEVPSTVTIPKGTNEGVIAVTLSDNNLGIGVNNLVIDIENDGINSVGNSTTVSYIQNCTEVSGSLAITFDGYGSETSWEITDALGGVVVSGGGYADGQVSATESITLCSGRDYTFTIKDVYGDGLSYPANGTYTLTIDGTVKASGGGDFGSSESTDFDTN
ncbi:hypothetical protein [Aestuariibaculum lutulentum]|uniref:Calx-beta domain-containing protein n=1 Tax=Aestuariibaculum lutulentum TaxID=2920935 RepID=A0ABS9RF07_9FLAO|nr:hypothetical protein [Aestuariibaculum lutulentum]MCH4551533.1 hypothetical protein [Aestuariibaculum lutulentum]